MRRLEQGTVSRRQSRAFTSRGAYWACARALLRSRGLVMTAFPELAPGSTSRRRSYVVSVQGLDGADKGRRVLAWTGVRWEVEPPGK